jgi:hypothetical protein
LVDLRKNWNKFIWIFLKNNGFSLSPRFNKIRR